MAAPTRLRIATRGSALARWQADDVAGRLRAAHPGALVDLVVVDTVGDQHQDVPIWQLGGQGVFVKEVQAALLDGRADVAVHSAKDLPSVTGPGLRLAAVPARDDPRDALVGLALADLPPGGVIATGSVRRRAQLAAARPDATFVGVRGSIATRLSRLPDGGTVVVAAAALNRLGLAARAAEYLSPDVVLPQVGQGALAVECREGDGPTASALAAIDDAGLHAALDAERAFLARLGSGCDLPVGAWATIAGGAIQVRGLIAGLDGTQVRRGSRTGPLADGTRLADDLAGELLAAGGDRLIAEARGVTVYLVGAGPGDPGLLTVRGAAVLAAADVVVHDRLAEAALLDLAPPSAERLDVGKAPGGPVHQDQINELLVAKGGTGAAVVRLKGGDPFVFGRGGEEAEALAAAGVPFEVVPGVTSAFAVPAYAGVPVTHRGVAAAVTVVTGHSRHSVEQDTNWEALATVGGTVVVLMGVAHRASIAARLMAGGLPGTTPVAAVTWGTRPEQHSLRTTLDALGSTPMEPPATIVIGGVAGLDVSWFERKPLFGRSVVVTRARAQASELSATLAGLGARPVEVATIRIAEPADGGAALAEAAARVAAGAFSWVVFTSPNGVERLTALLPDSRQWGATRIAAIGPGTAAALAGRYLGVDLVPERFVAESLVEGFGPPPAGETRPVLLARAAVARDVLPEGLARLGWPVEVVEAYRTVPGQVTEAALDAAARADAICFTSSSTVARYLAVSGGRPLPPVVACIGPVTAATAREAGLSVTVEAEPHTIGGLVDAVVGALGAPGSPP